MSRPRKPWFRKSNKRWYVEVNGKQINLGPNKKEAHRRFHQLMAQPEEQKKVAPNSLPAIVDAFLEWVHINRAPDTYEWYRYRLQRLLDRYPQLETTELKPHHIQTWVDSYRFSKTSQRNYMRSIKVCLDWAVQQGYLDRNPLFKMKIPTAESKEVALTQAEFDELLLYARNDDLKDLMIATWESGCRPQESLIVEARHVDLANQRWVFSKSEEKTKRFSRVVYLTDEALAITRRRMLLYPSGPIFRNCSGRRWTTDAVNCGFLAIQMRMGKQEMQRQGFAITDEEIAAFIPKLKKEARIRGELREKTAAELRCEAKRKLTHKLAARYATRHSLYSLRHSWATNALTRGVDPLTVAILMGHQDPSTLAKVYQHLSLNPQHLLDQAKKAAG